MQQAALKLLHRGEIAGVKNLTSYIFTMLENGARDFYRKRNRETVVADNVEEGSQSTEQQVLEREVKLVISKAINILDEKQRYVFVETEIKGRSYEELVRETGEKLGTLLSRKSRAVQKLKTIIKEYFKED